MSVGEHNYTGSEVYGNYILDENLGFLSPHSCLGLRDAFNDGPRYNHLRHVCRVAQ